MKTTSDAFSAFHPAVCFFFFIGAVVLGMVFIHPAYLAVSMLAAALYFLAVQGRSGLKTAALFLPVFVALSLINPLFSTRGEHVLFRLFSRPYTLEALFYGMAVGGMFVTVMLWFLSYNRVMTSDKFTALFGNIIPALSLLLVMILRLIPGYRRKADQIGGARKCIGHAANRGSTRTEKLRDGTAILSALTSWALESSVITADSMRSRGYGCGKRSHFRPFRFTARDAGMLAVLLFLLLGALIPAFRGAARAEFLPRPDIAPLRGGEAILGLVSYSLFLLVPSILDLWEALKWHILRSKI